MDPPHLCGGSKPPPRYTPRGQIKGDWGESLRGIWNIKESKMGIFNFFLIFSPLKNRFLGFSTKNFIFGFFAQKVGDDLVLAYFWLFWGFSTPSPLKSWFLGFSTKKFIQCVLKCCNNVATLLQQCWTLLQHCCNIVATFCCNILLQHFVATF